MYNKLPIKERMDLMKSYRKANPDMSYRDMVNDYNTSYEKFGDGGKKNLPIDFESYRRNPTNIYAKSQIEAEDMIKKGLINTRRRVDENGDDRGENLFEIFDPTGISSWNDVSKEYGRSGLSLQTGIEALGAVPLLSKVSKLLKPTIHLSKNAQNYVKFQKAISNSNASKTIDYLGKAGRASDGYQYVNADYEKHRYGGIQRFEDGGTKKEVAPYQAKSQADYIYRKQMYNDSLLLGSYTDIQKKLEPFNKELYDKGMSDTSEVGRYKEKTLENFIDKVKKNSPNITRRFGWGSPDLQHTIIQPTNEWKGHAINYNYTKPVQKILPFKKDETLSILTKTNTVVKSKPKENFKPKDMEMKGLWDISSEPDINPQLQEVSTDNYSKKINPTPVNTELRRHWNFNGPNPVMEYYDKSGKLINKEYYTGVNGKKIEPLTR
jgi:hypothetical protein